MNKYELFRAFQDVSSELIEEAERLTVQKPEFQSVQTEKPPIFMRIHEEEIMGKHSKLFRRLTGAAAVVALCSIGVAGYFAIRPDVTEPIDSTANNAAQETGSTMESASTIATEATTAVTAAPFPSDEFVEETMPPQVDENPIQNNTDEDDDAQRFDDGGFFSYSAGFTSGTDEDGYDYYDGSEIETVNGKKTALDFALFIEARGNRQPKTVSASIILMQEGELIPFSLEENGEPALIQKVKYSIPETEYSDMLHISFNSGVSESRREKIIEKLKAINGIKEVNLETVEYKTENGIEEDYILNVILTSKLLANDDNLYSEIYTKMKMLYGISQISRVPAYDLPSQSDKIKFWFTPHCRNQYSNLNAYVLYDFKGAPEFAGEGNYTSSSTLTLYCKSPDARTDSSEPFATASAEDYIDFPESAKTIQQAYGSVIGKKQNYGPDAGPNKYSINNNSWEKPEKINRDEIYLKVRYNPENMGFYGGKAPESVYALLLCDGKPMGLADGKDIVRFTMDNERTLNYKLTLNDSIKPGVHEFTLYLGYEDHAPMNRNNTLYYPLTPNNSVMLEVLN